MVNPITPEEADSRSKEKFPDEVIESINAAIIQNWNGHEAIVKQAEIVGRISSILNVTQKHILDKKWLDFERLFAKSGWSIQYHSADYTETQYPAYFTFRKKK